MTLFGSMGRPMTRAAGSMANSISPARKVPRPDPIGFRHEVGAARADERQEIRSQAIAGEALGPSI